MVRSRWSLNFVKKLTMFEMSRAAGKFRSLYSGVTMLLPGDTIEHAVEICGLCRREAISSSRH